MSVAVHQPEVAPPRVPPAARNPSGICDEQIDTAAVSNVDRDVRVEHLYDAGADSGVGLPNTDHLEPLRRSAPPDRKGWTTPIAPPNHRLARDGVGGLSC